nr:MAG TPA: hypothetical protein [Caudoviricetes sp.]
MIEPPPYLYLHNFKNSKVFWKKKGSRHCRNYRLNI